jgi:hypothetical protein
MLDFDIFVRLKMMSEMTDVGSVAENDVNFCKIFKNDVSVATAFPGAEDR